VRPAARCGRPGGGPGRAGAAHDDKRHPGRWRWAGRPASTPGSLRSEYLAFAGPVWDRDGKGRSTCVTCAAGSRWRVSVGVLPAVPGGSIVRAVARRRVVPTVRVRMNILIVRNGRGAV